MPIPLRTRQALLGPILLAALALAGCDRDTPDTETLNFFAFGTIVDITLYPAGAYDLERWSPSCRPSWRSCTPPGMPGSPGHSGAPTNCWRCRPSSAPPRPCCR